MNLMKLQKALQAAGLDNRRSIRKGIADGEFKVNNTVIRDPNFMVDISKDVIRRLDKKIKLHVEKKSYYIFNKPDGVVSTLDDPEGRPTVKDFVAGIKERVYPVGRLDFHSEGLILLTNDGDLANFIISPRNQVPKVYNIKIKGALSEEERRKLVEKGIHIEGSRVKPLRIEFLRKTARNNSWIQVVIVEGKKHILRKVFKYTGHPVEKLKRMAIGTIKLKKLPVGYWLELTKEEVETFKQKYGFEKEEKKPTNKHKKISREEREDTRSSGNS